MSSVNNKVNLCYRIRNQLTGLYKTSDHRYGDKGGFSATGHVWTSEDAVISFLKKWASWPRQSLTKARQNKSVKSIPHTWELVKYELVVGDVFNTAEFLKSKGGLDGSAS